MKGGVGLQRRCWRDDLLNHTELPGTRVRRLVCMARCGFRFAAGKPKGRRRVPTFLQEVQDLAPHGEVDRSIFYCVALSYVSVVSRLGMADAPGKEKK